MILSPFRYPGGKGKLLPVIMEYLDPLLKSQNHFVDLFVGGGSVLLQVAQQYPQHQLYANDKNIWIASFWKVVSDIDVGPFEELLQKISTQPTLDLFNQLRATDPDSEVTRAYYAIFFNRTTFSGIFSSGPIGGKEQKSKYTVDCRYNIKKLQQKIINCRELLVGRTKVTNEDFHNCKSFIDTDYPAYIDPPYYLKGDMLYPEKMSVKDHKDLFSCLKDDESFADNFILSYDDCPEIRNLYKDFKIIELSARYCINGKKDNWEHKNELLILP